MARIKKRRGKDLNILWQVTVSDGTSIQDVAASNQLKLEAYDQRNNLYELTIDSVDSDGIHAKFPGELQKNCGNYRLTLWINKDTDGTTVVDLQGAFELVPYSQMESSYNMLDVEGSLVITTMDIEYGLTRLAEFAGAISDLQEMVIDTFTSEVSGNNLALTIESVGGYSWAVTLTPVTSSAPGLMTPGMLAQLNQASQDCEQNERDIDANQQAIAALQQALQTLSGNVRDLQDTTVSDFTESASENNIVLIIETNGGYSYEVTLPIVSAQAAGLMSPALLAQINTNAQDILELQRELNDLDLSTDSVTEDGSTQREINTELRKALKTMSVQYGDTSNIVLEGEKINGNTQTYTIPAATEQAAGAMSAAHVAALGDLDERLTALEVAKITFSLSASPSWMWYGETVSVALRATASATATSMAITSGGTTLNSGTNVTTLQYTDSSVSAAKSYAASAVIKGTNKSASASVSIAYPKYIGAGDAYTDIISDAGRLRSLVGTHTITTTEGQRIWMVTDVQINSCKYNGFDFPLESQTTTLNGKTYYIYNSDTMVANTFEIVIS